MFLLWVVGDVTERVADDDDDDGRRDCFTLAVKIPFLKLRHPPPCDTPQSVSFNAVLTAAELVVVLQTPVPSQSSSTLLGNSPSNATSTVFHCAQKTQIQTLFRDGRRKAAGGWSARDISLRLPKLSKE